MRCRKPAKPAIVGRLLCARCVQPPQQDSTTFYAHGMFLCKRPGGWCSTSSRRCRPRLRDAALALRLAAKCAAFALRCRVTTATFAGAAMKYPISVAALVFLLVGGVGAEPVLKRDAKTGLHTLIYTDESGKVRRRRPASARPAPSRTAPSPPGTRAGCGGDPRPRAAPSARWPQRPSRAAAAPPPPRCPRPRRRRVSMPRLALPRRAAAPQDAPAPPPARLAGSASPCCAPRPARARCAWRVKQFQRMFCWARRVAPHSSLI